MPYTARRTKVSRHKKVKKHTPNKYVTIDYVKRCLLNTV